MKILILTNHQLGLYKFRKELLEALVADKHKVYVSVPEDEFTEELEKLHVKVINNMYLNRRGINPLHELKLFNYYKWLLKKITPDIVLTYTIKPNVYGGYLCGKMGVPYIANVTGLGTSIQNSGILRALSLRLYKIGLRKAEKIFFQNEDNFAYMHKCKIVNLQKVDILPGSGVNTEQHCYEPYPKDDKKVIFTTIGRIMKDKGINEVLRAAEVIKEKCPGTEFRLIGDFDEEYEDQVMEFERRGIIEYLGFQKDVHSYIAESHAIIHASYHEGMSNILLEAASTGRPVIATDVHGCIETFEPDITGISFKARDPDSLIKAIEKFQGMSYDQKAEMGKAGRAKMEREFNRTIIVDKYMDEVKKFIKG